MSEPFKPGEDHSYYGGPGYENATKEQCAELDRRFREAARPVRLRLSRKHGFELQALSRETNGLDAVNVTRQGAHSGMWGNWAAKRAGTLTGPLAIAAFQQWVDSEASWAWKGRAVIDLRGRNLACTCKPGDPCHADVLLELANREKPDE